MNPTLIHRYSWPIREAIEALLGDAAGDCQRWDIRVESGELVIDVVEPSSADDSKTSQITDIADERLKRSGIEHYFVEDGSPHDRYVEQPSNNTAKSDAAAEERKGGPLARRAAMLCNEKGFWTFSETESAEEAAEWLRDLCGVKSRADIDHFPHAQEQFEKVDGKYRRWLQGYDD